MNLPNLIILLSNDIIHDRRMSRISAVLSEFYKVYLIGRKLNNTYEKLNSNEHLLSLIFNKGPLFYLELNIRLLFHLIKHRPEIVYVVDFDTLIAGRWYQMISRKKLIFDSHELFTDVPELKNRNFIRRIWHWIGSLCIPHANLCISVSEPISKLLGQRYSNQFYTIRNLPLLESHDIVPKVKSGKLRLVYLGVLNPGRGLEKMLKVVGGDTRFHLDIIGNGPLKDELVELSHTHTNLGFHGMLHESQFSSILSKCDIGLNLLDPESESYRLSLANKFFDYMHYGLAILTMNFPCYRLIDHEWHNCILVDELSQDSIRSSLYTIINDPKKLQNMQDKSKLASHVYNWQAESLKLVDLLKDHIL